MAKKYLVESNRTLGVLVPTGMLPHEQGGGGAGGMVHHAPALDEAGPLPQMAPLPEMAPPPEIPPMRVTRGTIAMDEVAR